MKHFSTVLVLIALSLALATQAGDGGGASGANEKVSEHKRVKAIYWNGGYMLSRADEKTYLELGGQKPVVTEKKKPAASKK